MGRCYLHPPVGEDDYLLSSIPPLHNLLQCLHGKYSIKLRSTSMAYVHQQHEEGKVMGELDEMKKVV